MGKNNKERPLTRANRSQAHSDADRSLADYQQGVWLFSKLFLASWALMMVLWVVL